MHLLGYLASAFSVVVYCSCTAGSSVGRGFEGRAAAQQRGRRRHLGAVLIEIVI